MVPTMVITATGLASRAMPIKGMSSSPVAMMPMAMANRIGDRTVMRRAFVLGGQIHSDDVQPHLDAATVEDRGSLIDPHRTGDGGEDDRRVDHLRPRNGDSLCLAPGELTDAALLHASQPHGAEPLGGMADGLVLRCAIEHEGQRSVLHGSELEDEHALLEDEPEGFTSQSGTVPGGEGLDVDGTSGQVQLDAAGISGEDPRQAVQQSGLARTRRSHDGDRLAGGDGEVDWSRARVEP